MAYSEYQISSNLVQLVHDYIDQLKREYLIEVTLNEYESQFVNEVYLMSDFELLTSIGTHLEFDYAEDVVWLNSTKTHKIKLDQVRQWARTVDTDPFGIN